MIRKEQIRILMEIMIREVNNTTRKMMMSTMKREIIRGGEGSEITTEIEGDDTKLERYITIYRI